MANDCYHRLGLTWRQYPMHPTFGRGLSGPKVGISINGGHPKITMESISLRGCGAKILVTDLVAANIGQK
jgi:hypothetical protein